jgi:hypothetical protein
VIFGISYIELDIKDTTYTAKSASFFSLSIAIYIAGLLKTTVSDKRDDCNFLILNFPFICNNIPAPPACGIYIAQLIRRSRTCASYHDALDRGCLRTRKLQNEGCIVVKLKPLLRKFYGRHHDLVSRWPVANDHGHVLKGNLTAPV